MTVTSAHPPPQQPLCVLPPCLPTAAAAAPPLDCWRQMSGRSRGRPASPPPNPVLGWGRGGRSGGVFVSSLAVPFPILVTAFIASPCEFTPQVTSPDTAELYRCHSVWGPDGEVWGTLAFSALKENPRTRHTAQSSHQSRHRLCTSKSLAAHRTGDQATSEPAKMTAKVLAAQKAQGGFRTQPVPWPSLGYCGTRQLLGLAPRGVPRTQGNPFKGQVLHTRHPSQLFSHSTPPSSHHGPGRWHHSVLIFHGCGNRGQASLGLLPVAKAGLFIWGCL